MNSAPSNYIFLTRSFDHIVVSLPAVWLSVYKGSHIQFSVARFMLFICPKGKIPSRKWITDLGGVSLTVLTV